MCSATLAAASETIATFPGVRAYWFVLRYDGPGIPPTDIVPYLAEKVASLQFDARRRGIQLDLDILTPSLPKYATSLRKIKAALPPAIDFSITTRLD